MVQIPTSRDIGRVSARSGRIANSAPTNPIGEAVAGFGQDMVRAAYDLNDLRTQESVDTQRKTGFDLETKIAEFRDREEQGFLKARDETSESGIGFTRQFIEGYQARADEFGKSNFEGLTDAQKASAKQSILGLGNSLYEKANSYERVAKTNFYDRTTNQGLDKVRTQINNNAAPYEELKRQGLAAIEAADMPEPWKAERRALWNSDAAESKWQWKFKSNPKEAIAQIKSPQGGNVGRAYQRLISKGWTPAQAAGVVGNLTAESGGSLNTQARNPGDGSDGSDSIGVAQWNGARAKALKAFAADRGTDWHDFDTQIDFVDHELRTSERGAGENLARATNAEEAAAAFTGYERPAGWSAGNAKGSHNWTGRRDAALRIAGENPASEDPDLESIPFDRRQQLAAAGENEYNQVVTRERAASKDRYSLLIASKPEGVDENVILNDTSIDNGDKAQLITSLRSAKKDGDGVNAFLGAFASGEVTVNPFDGKQTGIADKGYDKLMTGAANDDERKVITSDFINRMGYIPKKVQAELRRGASSTDVAVVAQSMEAGLVLSKNAPISFNAFEGSGVVRDKMDLYRAYTQDMGYSPQEAARRLVDAADPAKASQRDALLKSKTVADELKKVSTDTVASAFDAGLFSSSPSLGPTPQAEAVMVSEYRSIYQEAIVDAGGDLIAAKKAADTRFQRSYGVSNLSTLGNNVVVKNPPEKAYPAAPDGTFDYIRDQLAQSMKNQGITADDYYLQPYEMTEKDIRAGKPPRYSVFYKKDGKIERFNIPFVADPEVMQKSFKAQKTGALRTSEQKMTDNRGREVEVRQNVDDALQNTEGPDWMKAQAAGAVQERARQDNTIEDLGGFNPGPIGTGGGGGY